VIPVPGALVELLAPSRYALSEANTWAFGVPVPWAMPLSQDWPATLVDIERGAIDLEPASELANRWASQHVLLLNSSLTLSRFQVSIDAHQSHGHLPIWRPLIARALKVLADRNTPLVIITFGEVAAGILSGTGFESPTNNVVTILRKHPAEADHVLAAENPFQACNRQLEAMGAEPISW
jgi:uracil-DNA glycosylase